jgi:hypothetical protein
MKLRMFLQNPLAPGSEFPAGRFGSRAEQNFSGFERSLRPIAHRNGLGDTNNEAVHRPPHAHNVPRITLLPLILEQRTRKMTGRRYRYGK